MAQFTTKKSQGVVPVAAAMPVTTKEPAPGVQRTLESVASVPPRLKNTLEVAAHALQVTVTVEAAAAKANRPRAVLIVVLPGVPELSV
jgi:hypothetical protein